MTNNEDKQFLAMQRMEVASCSMVEVNRKLLEREARKRLQSEACERRKIKEAEQESWQMKYHGKALSSASFLFESSECDTGDDTDKDFTVPSSVD